MSVNKIEGVPEGWELVGIGTAYLGDSVVGPCGDIIVCNNASWNSKNYVIVRKIEPPKPTYIPWTFETCPVGAVVKWIDGTEFTFMITAKTANSAGQSGNYYLYQLLFDKFERLDGTPCGTLSNG